MTAEMRALLDRLEQLQQRLSQPDAASDPERLRVWMKEYNDLLPAAEKIRALASAEASAGDARALLAEEGIEEDLRQLAADELAQSRAAAERLEREIRALLLPRDPRDERPAIVEIRAGTGGEEAALFAAALFRMYRMYAERRGFALTVLNESPTELGGCKEITFLLEGNAPFSRMKYERGVHRVQRVPDTETQGRIHTSAVTVAVLPEADEVAVSIDPADLRIDTYRSSGAGGQHINKTESAIRITHLPTGLVVECQDERSQHKNREKAMRVLRSRLQERAQAAQNEQIASDRRSQVGTGDRSERIRTYNFPQGRVTDHRIGLTLYRLAAVLDGDLDELIDALAQAERTAKLRQFSEGERTD